MRKVLLAAALGLVVAQVGAAGPGDYTPEFKLYTSFNFGGHQQQSLGLHYGLRMDHDSREPSLFGVKRPAIAQVDFSQASGFEKASIYGMPLTRTPYQQMNFDNPALAAGIWFGSFAALGGIIYGIHEAAKDDAAPTPAAAGGPQVPQVCPPPMVGIPPNCVLVVPQN